MTSGSRSSATRKPAFRADRLAAVRVQLDDLGPRTLGEERRPVRRTIVHHQNLVGVLQRAEHDARDEAFLVERRDHRYRSGSGAPQRAKRAVIRDRGGEIPRSPSNPSLGADAQTTDASLRSHQSRPRFAAGAASGGSVDTCRHKLPVFGARSRSPHERTRSLLTGTSPLVTTRHTGDASPRASARYSPTTFPDRSGIDHRRREPCEVRWADPPYTFRTFEDPQRCRPSYVDDHRILALDGDPLGKFGERTSARQGGATHSAVSAKRDGQGSQRSRPSASRQGLTPRGLSYSRLTSSVRGGLGRHTRTWPG